MKYLILVLLLTGCMDAKFECEHKCQSLGADYYSNGEQHGCMCIDKDAPFYAFAKRSTNNLATCLEQLNACQSQVDSLLMQHAEEKQNGK